MAKKVIPPADPKVQQPAAKPITPQEEQKEALYNPGEYEITPDEDFQIDIYLQRKGKRWVVVQNEQMADEKHWALFRMWSYEEQVQMRKDATNFDMVKRMHLVDNDTLNRLKLKTLLKAWTFDKNNQRLELNHINGVLPDEVFSRVMNLHPNILNYIIEQMNAVLEYNA